MCTQCAPWGDRSGSASVSARYGDCSALFVRRDNPDLSPNAPIEPLCIWASSIPLGIRLNWSRLEMATAGLLSVRHRCRPPQKSLF